MPQHRFIGLTPLERLNITLVIMWYIQLTWYAREIIMIHTRPQNMKECEKWNSSNMDNRGEWGRHAVSPANDDFPFLREPGSDDAHAQWEGKVRRTGSSEPKTKEKNKKTCLSSSVYRTHDQPPRQADRNVFCHLEFFRNTPPRRCLYGDGDNDDDNGASIISFQNDFHSAADLTIQDCSKL